MRGLARTANRSGQRQARGAASERRPPARSPRPWEAFHGVPIRSTQPGQSKTHRTTLRCGLAGVWGCLTPRVCARLRQLCQARACRAARAVPATDVHRRAGPHTPTGRCDWAADHHDAGEPLCGLASPCVDASSAEVQPRLVSKRQSATGVPSRMGANRHRGQRGSPRWSWKLHVMAGTGGASALAPKRRLRCQARARHGREQALGTSALPSRWEAGTRPGSPAVRSGRAAATGSQPLP
jgi:hypothetical protein